MSKLKYKRCVIKEELVAITDDYKLAIVLNQFLYWTPRISQKKYEKFEEEEMDRHVDDTENLEGGWIYKKSEELAEEVMLGISVSTSRRYCDRLKKMGYLLERRNPDVKFDKTIQYRVNLKKVVLDVREKGFELQEYKTNKLQSLSKSIFQNENTNFQNENSNFQNRTAIPKTTTEITLEEEEEGEQFSKLSTKTINFFQSLFNKRMTFIDYDMITELYTTDDVIQEALRFTAKYSKNRVIGYTLSVLEDWKKQGVESLEDLQKVFIEHDKKKEGNKSSNSSKQNSNKNNKNKCNPDDYDDTSSNYDDSKAFDMYKKFNKEKNG